MTTVVDPPQVKEVLTDGVLLHNVSWATYESLLRDHPDAASPRLTYDRGDLLTSVAANTSKAKVVWPYPKLLQKS